MSDDGATSIVIIGLVGNPFSPAYARARAAGSGVADALGFSSLNVAIRGSRDRVWSLRERALGPFDRSADALVLGASVVHWSADRLEISIDERTTPILGIGARPVRGKVVFRPSGLTERSYVLDEHGRHVWWPVAPRGRIEVRLDEPALRFEGAGYHDANAGDEPVDRGFSDWTWSRGHVPHGDTVVVYETHGAGPRGASITHAFRWNGRESTSFVAPRARPFRPSLWGIPRAAHADPGHAPRLVKMLEDTPFYARSLVDTRIDGTSLQVVHESLAAQRLGKPWVRHLLEYKMGKG